MVQCLLGFLGGWLSKLIFNYFLLFFQIILAILNAKVSGQENAAFINFLSYCLIIALGILEILAFLWMLYRNIRIYKENRDVRNLSERYQVELDFILIIIFYCLVGRKHPHRKAANPLPLFAPVQHFLRGIRYIRHFLQCFCAATIFAGIALQPSSLHNHNIQLFWH